MSGGAPRFEMISQEGLQTANGVSERYCSLIVQDLSGVIARMHRLIRKTRSNRAKVVSSPNLQAMLERHHAELDNAVGMIVQRAFALGKGHELKAQTVGAEDVHHEPSQDPIGALIDEHERVVSAMRRAADVAGDFGDLVTEDLLSQRIVFHEQAIPSLRSLGRG